MSATAEDVLAGLEGFAGDLLREGDPGYEEARRIHNGMIDKRPWLIARCQGVADIAAAVNFAREGGYEVAVRGGGHGAAGKAVTDGGVMIDLSRMRGIHVDAAARTARAQGGATWADVNRETQLHGLAVTGGVVSTTGIGGLTLGGGLGWMMSKYGLATDNLLAIEAVTADGSVRAVSESENADLFWGMRGGGGNLGIAASFLYQLHPVGPIITGGLIIHPFDAARDLARFYREFTADPPEELTVFFGLIHAPDGSGAPLCGTLLCHIGSLEQAQQDLEPLLSFGSPIEITVGPMPYTAMNAVLDEAFAPGLLNYWKSSFLSDLSDGAIEVLVEQFAKCPSPMTALVLEEFHGAVTRVPVDAMAVPHRQPGYNVVIPSVWIDPATTEANLAWTRETFAALEPYMAGRRYVNYIGVDDGSDAVRAAYGPNYDRLAQLKAKYDPDNLFRLNANIAPAG
jgi:FAD/FMN-containing dehydrogenase